MLLNTGLAPHLDYICIGLCVAPNEKQATNNFPSQWFSPNIPQTFSQFPHISWTAVKLPNIYRFSRQVIAVIIKITMNDVHRRSKVIVKSCDGSEQSFNL